MMRHSKSLMCTMAMLAAVASGSWAHDGPAWDGYLIARAYMEADGTFIACENANAVPEDERCVIKGWVNKILSEKPQRMSGQQLIEKRLRERNISGKPEFVGVGPWIVEGSHFASTASDRHLLYYRLVDHPLTK
jgi:hypothetical protein